MIAPLHNHSYFSALDGFSSPEEIADRIVHLGGTCCGLTDHGVVTGHLDFSKAMQSRGLKPIFGCELYHGLKKDGFKARERDQAHLIALAMSDEGLQNLWRLVDRTSRRDHFHNVGRVYLEDIAELKQGIVFTSACALGHVSQGILRGDTSVANQYLDTLGDNFVIEISTYPAGAKFKDQDSDDAFDPRAINEALVAFAMERGLMMVYGDDGHYAWPEQYEVHDAYIARQTGQSIFTPIDERTMWHPEDALVIKSEEMVRENLDYLPSGIVDEIIANTVDLAERSEAKLPDVSRHLPAFIPGGCPWLDDADKILTPEELFVELIYRGIVERYGEDAPVEVWERTCYEVETLLRDGIHHYFLMGWDEMQIAESLGIERGPGRGSAAGCICSYALGITDVDPLYYDLIFERFWNPGRAKGFPDIDTDFSRARRPEMIAKLIERYGEDRVVSIGTTGYLKPKATIDKMAKACGITFEEAEQLKAIVGKTTKIDILGHEQIGWNPELEPGKKYYVSLDCGEEIDAWCASDSQRAELRRYFIQICEICCSRVAQYGIHASGIVICDVPTDAIAPTYRRGGKDGIPATMFDMSEVDSLMLVKLDVLGLRTLDVLEYWRDLMVEKHDIRVKWSGLDKEEHPQEMWDMLQKGYTAGIFQVEDGYGKQLCKMMNPSSILDLSALVALNRPGPIQAGIPDSFVARRNGSEEITFLHPRLEEILAPLLKDTYGLFVYQEQIINFFNALDYTLGESDAIRKIMGKKKPEQMDAVRDGLDEWEGRGYLDMAVVAGIPRDIAQLVWDDLEGFADYCFNKSHSVAYAILAFRTLFAKYYGPAEFYASCIRSLDPSTDGDKRKSMLPQFVNECRRQKIEVMTPTIATGRGWSHVLEDGTLVFGFSDIAGIKSSGRYIEELRDSIGLDISSGEAFQASFEAYNEEWNRNKKELVKVGAWDAEANPKSPKQSLTSNKITALIQADVFGDRELTLAKRQLMELEMFGVVISDNSIEVLDRNAERLVELDSWDDLLTPWDDKVFDEDQQYLEYQVPGVVSNVEEKRTRKGNEPFGIVTIEYEGNTLEFTVWTKDWKSHKFLFKVRTPAIFLLRQRPDNDYGASYNFQKGQILK